MRTLKLINEIIWLFLSIVSLAIALWELMQQGANRTSAIFAGLFVVALFYYLLKRSARKGEERDSN